MAIFSAHLSEIRRSKSENAVKSAAYISGSRLSLEVADKTAPGLLRKITWDFSSKAGVVYSVILAPDNSCEWIMNREQLWNRAEKAETRLRAQTGRRFLIALPRELTEEQNIELSRAFALDYLVSHGMVVDLNIHYDNEHNPHLHLQMTTRELVRNEDGSVVFARTKNRDWGRTFFINYLRSGVESVINDHLELHGHLSRISHLSHKARGIELIPGIHEGAARHMTGSERRILNDEILRKNSQNIRDNPELVFHKLSINKPVFTKEDIARALSDACLLYTSDAADE